jgi:hypothetical protein
MRMPAPLDPGPDPWPATLPPAPHQNHTRVVIAFAVFFAVFFLAIGAIATQHSTAKHPAAVGTLTWPTYTYPSYTVPPYTAPRHTVPIYTVPPYTVPVSTLTPYANAAGRFYAAFPGTPSEAVHHWPVLTGVSVDDHWFASTGNGIVYELRYQDLPTKYADTPSTTLRALVEYWRGGLDGTTTESTPTLMYGRSALLATVVHPVNGTQTRSMVELTIYGNRAYWLSVSGSNVTTTTRDQFVRQFNIQASSVPIGALYPYSAPDGSFSIKLLSQHNGPPNPSSLRLVSGQSLQGSAVLSGGGQGRQLDVDWFRLPAGTEFSTQQERQQCEREATPISMNAIEIGGAPGLECVFAPSGTPFIHTERVLSGNGYIFLIETYAPTSSGDTGLYAAATSFTLLH